MAEQSSQSDSDSSESDQEDAEETERERDHDLSKFNQDNVISVSKPSDNYKGGIDGPAGLANAGPLSGDVRNAGPLSMSWTPPTLLSRCGNLAVEHAH